jgi:hypothetical protein
MSRDADVMYLCSFLHSATCCVMHSTAIPSQQLLAAGYDWPGLPADSWQLHGIQPKGVADHCSVMDLQVAQYYRLVEAACHYYC